MAENDADSDSDTPGPVSTSFMRPSSGTQSPVPRSRSPSYPTRDKHLNPGSPGIALVDPPDPPAPTEHSNRHVSSRAPKPVYAATPELDLSLLSWSMSRGSHLIDYFLNPDRQPTQRANAKASTSTSPTSPTSPSSPSSSLIPPSLCPPALPYLISLVSVCFIAICAAAFILVSPDTKNCRLPYMNESYRFFPEFNTSYSPMASKYSIKLYREQYIELEHVLNGVPVIFIPGNAGSFRQVRSLAAEAAYQYHDYSLARRRLQLPPSTKRGLDLFTVDFGEDLTAFHGQTLQGQAEYLNEAVAYILSLYETQSHAHGPRSFGHFPAPKSVILIGHSMGGMVARTMFTLPNYRDNSINTVLTFAAPHSLPPASFDSDMVGLYESVNRYWHDAFSQDSIGRNALSQVTAVSIAGGSLDQMIPSDHASISFVVPPSNGITVFTSTIPSVWSAIDHQAVIWCDQLRKVVASALLDIVDARFPSMTKSVSDRMDVFRSSFLTGLESPIQCHEGNPAPPPGGAPAANCVDHRDWQPDTLLAFSQGANVFVSRNHSIRAEVGMRKSQSVHVLPLHPGEMNGTLLSFLTNQKLQAPKRFSTVGDDVDFAQPYHGNDVETGLYALACRRPTSHQEVVGSLLSALDITTSSRRGSATRLICKNLASHVSQLPQADPDTVAALPLPHDTIYSSFLHYNLEQFPTYEMIVVVDTNTHGSALPGFIMADITKPEDVHIDVDNSLWSLVLGSSKKVDIPSDHPVMIDVSFKSVWSSLLSYTLTVADDYLLEDPYFIPFFRQYVEDPYESKFYLNVLPGTSMKLNMHGVAPFSPFNVREGHEYHNLHLQIWSDARGAANSSSHLQLALKLDLWGSVGKLALHYRMALTFLPIVVLTLVFAIQLDLYSTTGVFISLGTAMRVFIRKYLLWLLMFVSLLHSIVHIPLVEKLLYIIEPSMDLSMGEGIASAFDMSVRNQFFLGLERNHLWILGPIFILIATGMCHITYCLIIVVVTVASRLAIIGNYVWEFVSPQSQTVPQSSGAFSRLLVGVILVATSSVIPYQLSFIIVCLILFGSLVQTEVQLLQIPEQAQSEKQGEKPSDASERKSAATPVESGNRVSPWKDRVTATSFFNYSCSVLVLLIWLIPSNAASLAVWLHNLGIRWSMPFNSLDNLVSVTPVILIAERIFAQRMLPRMTKLTQRLLTQVMLVYISLYCQVFGMQRSFWIHHLFNFFFAWLLVAYGGDTLESSLRP